MAIDFSKVEKEVEITINETTKKYAPIKLEKMIIRFDGKEVYKYPKKGENNV